MFNRPSEVPRPIDRRPPVSPNTFRNLASELENAAQLQHWHDCSDMIVD